MIDSKEEKNLWEYVSYLQKLISIYQNNITKPNKEIQNKLDLINSLIRRKKESEIDLEELHTFCVNEWEKIISKVITVSLSRINSRKTKGSEFSDVKIQLNKLREDVEIEDYDLNQYEGIFENDLKALWLQIEEKIEIERYNKKQFIKGIFIGFISGMIGGFILYAFGFA